MGMTDSIADMLTRVRNGLRAQLDVVEVPHSKMNERLAEILVEEGFLAGFHIGMHDVRKGLFVTLKYGDDRAPIISEIKRVSKPGRRVYVRRDALPRVVSGFGMSILSTSKGVMTSMAAKKAGLGGELIATVW